MISFFVHGKAEPGGSKRAFTRPGKQFASVVDANSKTKPWQQQVAGAAAVAYSGPLLTGAVHLALQFRFVRPKCHYGSGKKAGTLKPSAPTHHTNKPDTTKLTRALEDALVGIILRDDRQVASQQVTKRYCNEGELPGAEVLIAPL